MTADKPRGANLVRETFADITVTKLP